MLAEHSFGIYTWKLEPRRQENIDRGQFRRQLGMLACESSKAPITKSRLLEAVIGCKHPRPLSLGEKGRDAFNVLISRATASRESLHNDFQQS